VFEEPEEDEGQQRRDGDGGFGSRGPDLDDLVRVRHGWGASKTLPPSPRAS
jgi:hypothetical protein